jgi:molybdate transport system regulatory protein
MPEQDFLWLQGYRMNVYSDARTKLLDSRQFCVVYDTAIQRYNDAERGCPVKVSARNVFKGEVGAVKTGAVNAEVDVVLEGGDHLTAVITMESVKTLALAVGKPVVAMVKAPWVMLMTDQADVRLSARNCLAGTVKSVQSGAVNAEVALALPGGTEISAIVTRESVNELGLKPGVAATAVIKASSIILGVPG